MKRGGGHLNPAQRWALMVPVMMLLSALILLFAPLNADMVMSGPAGPLLHRTPDPALEHYESVRIHCGSLLIRKSRHNPACSWSVRERRTLSYAVAASAVIVAVGAYLVFRRKTFGRQRLLAFLGLVIAVTGVIMLFRPLRYEWFDDQVKVYPGRTSYAAVPSSCGSVVFRGLHAQFSSEPCSGIYVVNTVFAAAIVVAGFSVPVLGRLVLGKETDDGSNDQLTSAADRAPTTSRS